MSAAVSAEAPGAQASGAQVPKLRPLTDDEHQAFALARLRTLEHLPYFQHAILALRPLAAEGLGTFAVDRYWRLYIDPQSLREWGTAEASGVLGHEVEHMVRDHAGRGEAIGSHRHPLAWNYATDAAINPGLLAQSVPLPEGVITPEALDLAPGGFEESYFQQLCASLPPDESDEGEAGCGSGAGGPAAGWELGQSDSGPEGVAAPVGPARGDLIRRATAQAVREHAASGRGTVPASLARWAEDQLRAPALDWKRLLPALVRRAIHYQAGRREQTFARLPRVRVPGFILPGAQDRQITVAIVADTSASMSAAHLNAAVAEVGGVVRAAGIRGRGVPVLACDADVAATTHVRRLAGLGSSIDLAGGGGTDMRVGIAAAEALRPRPDVIVVLTDGYTPWPATPTRASLIAGIINSTGEVPLAPDGGNPYAVPSWAHTVGIATAD